jgi:dienelactone hydrolase
VSEQYAELRAFYKKQHETAYQPLRGEAARAKLRELIGAVDSFTVGKVSQQLQRDTEGIRVSLVEWPISRIGAIGPTAGASTSVVRQYGVLLEPAGTGKREAMITIADAGEKAADAQFGYQLAKTGKLIYMPLFTRRRAFSQPWLEDRQWLMRLAYQTGRHIIGAEVQQVLLAREWLAGRDDVSRAGVWGKGQGGLTALLAGALDSHLEPVISEGYLDDPEKEWDQPEDRILWSWRRHFRNDDLRVMAGRRFQAPPWLPFKPVAMLSLDAVVLSRIANHQFVQWQAYFRNKAIETSRLRAKAWQPDFSSPAAYERSIAANREAYFDMIGRYPAPLEPLSARSVMVYDEPECKGWRLSVRVYEGVHAYGILLVPTGIRAGERRPVVMVQHGPAGKPEDSLGVVPNQRADAVYQRFGWQLVKRGYIVFAPMIATQDNVERTKLVRRCHPVGMIPAGMDARKFGRVLDYLSTLDYVDKERCSFYGLSYGGYTALWTGPAEPRFKVVISSGHYNDWAVKTTDLTLGTAYPLYFNVFDQYNFGMLNRFNHSDLAALIAPRAFLVEMGSTDGVIVEPRDAADAEISRALEVWRRLGLADRAACARFDGPHRIDGTEAFAFLDRWLKQ